jgi:hypothetical protein
VFKGTQCSLIMEQTYDLSDPTIDSQLINLSKSGAVVFYNISTGKASSHQSARRPSLAESRCNYCLLARSAARFSMPPASRMRRISSRSAIPKRLDRGAGKRTRT